ncbi:PEP-CTERM sorting domain-containing protein [Granulicella sp. L60]
MEVTYSPVPEPSSFALLGTGADLFGAMRRKLAVR